MRNRTQLFSNFFRRISRILASGLVAAGLVSGAHAGTYRIIHSFAGFDGDVPLGTMIMDASGNLYGVTAAGGDTTSSTCTAGGCGTVFELSPDSSDEHWTVKVLYQFTGGADGSDPQTGLTMDSSGNLYGTAIHGANTSMCSYGCGVVFELSPTTSGEWKETTLHTFVGTDGSIPLGKLALDASGNLYGAAEIGGAYGDGVLFELSPETGGAWKYSIMHEFRGGTDGALPYYAGLSFGPDGNLYGTAADGGNLNDCEDSGCGVVFRLTPKAGGGWTETVLFDFGGPDGANPLGNLIFDAVGNLYGIAGNGGVSGGCNYVGCGLVYELSPTASGPWKETVLREFQPGSGGFGNYYGGLAEAGPILDATGNLYDTAAAGGQFGEGVVFRLTPGSSAPWTETVLYAFSGGAKGGSPGFSGLIIDAAGNLFGTSSNGGSSTACDSDSCGTVFEITP